MAPTSTNEPRQPTARASIGRTSGVTMAPMFPEPLEIPNATERSFAENSALMVFTEAGVPIDSVAPSAIRARENWPMVMAQPCDMAARLQAATPAGVAHFTPSRSTIQPVPM